MKGESLYAVWCEEMEKQGVSVDPWEDLGEHDRRAWNELARFVEELVMKAGGVT